jgi:hypothetical protein
MEAVEELATFAQVHARPLDDEARVISEYLASRVIATPEQHLAAVATVQKMIDGLAKASEGAKASSRIAQADDPNQAVTQSDGSDPAVGEEDGADPFSVAIRPVIHEAFDAIGEISPDPDAVLHYLQAYSVAKSRVARLSVLNASLLTSAVSNFEVLVSALVKQFLREKPQALRSDDTKYSLAEISAFQSLEEFRDFSADRYVEGILRGSFDDWMTWFERQLKIKLEQVARDPSALREIFQRRHLFVHNGGRVNRLYLSKLPDLVNPPAIDTELVVESDYLSATVDALTSAGTVLAAFVMRKLIPSKDNEHIADSLVNAAAYEFLRTGRWRIVIALTSAMADGCASEYTRYIMRVNGWIARKRSEGPEAIRAEVEAWEVSALAPRLKLARLALLDRTKEAHVLARTLLEREEIEQSDWRDWPLLDEVRQYHREQEALDSDSVDEHPDESSRESSDVGATSSENGPSRTAG